MSLVWGVHFGHVQLRNIKKHHFKRETIILVEKVTERSTEKSEERGAFSLLSQSYYNVNCGDVTFI